MTPQLVWQDAGGFLSRDFSNKVKMRNYENSVTGVAGVSKIAREVNKTASECEN